MSDEFAYLKGELTAERIQDEITEFWSEIQRGPKLKAEVEAAGIDYNLLSNLSEADAITVRVDSSGADPASVLLVIAFAPTGNRILKDLWTSVILPRIRRRWGDDAIRDEPSRPNQ